MSEKTKIHRRRLKSTLIIAAALLALTSAIGWADSGNRPVSHFFLDGHSFQVEGPERLINKNLAKDTSYVRFVSNLDDAEKMRNKTFDYQNRIFREFTAGPVWTTVSELDNFDPRTYVIQHYLYPEGAVYFGDIPDTVMSRMGPSDCLGQCAVSFNAVAKVKGFYLEFTYIVAAGKLTPNDFAQHEKILESSIQSFLKQNQ